ncbi:MAG: DUF2752 domain-containing protein [Polyangia bacterium]
MSRSRARGVQLGLLLACCAAWLILALLALHDNRMLPVPLEGLASFLGSCPYRSSTGETCPLCGTATAALRLLSGDAAASLRINPLALALIVPGAVQTPYRAWRALRPRMSAIEEIAIDAACLLWAVGVLAISSIL